VTLVVISLIIVALVIWGFVGRLPFQSSGLGVILQQGGHIYPISAPASGTITKVYVSVGDHVSDGQAIVEIALPDQEAQRQGTQRTLENYQALYKQQSTDGAHEIALRRKATDEQVASLRKKIAATEDHLSFLKNYYKILEQEMQRGYVTRQQLESTSTQITSAEQTIRDSYDSISQAESSQIDFEDSQSKSLAQLQSQIISTENELNNLNVSINTRRVVHSPVEGTVVEIATKLGSDVNQNDQLVMIQQKGGHLQMVAYLPVTTSKTVQAGMTALVSPTTVESSIYGSIKGRVVSVSELPASRASAKDILGNDTVVSQMFSNGPVIQAVIALDQDPRTVSGVAWTSSKGPPFKVTPGSMASVAVTVMEDRPVDLVVPIYETWIATN
jgi:HlyD family secretion protein